MGKHIFEEGPRQGHAAGDSSVEQQASQLVSDIKYKVRKKMKETSGSNLSPAQVQAKYREMFNSSPAPGAVKAIAKKKLFGEGVEVIGEEEKYIVKVVDKATGNTNRRKADRAKIAELRANSNIRSVEIVRSVGANDQDGDGDNDFADVMSARMQASGMSKKKANDKVKDKPYNENFSNWREELGVTEAKNVHGEIEVPSGNIKKLSKKATNRIDIDVDGDVEHNDTHKGEYGEFVPTPDGKRKFSGPSKVKESFDLFEVEDKKERESNKQIKEDPSIKNKVVVNPDLNLGEAIDQIGGTIVETELFEGILDDISDSELAYLSNEVIEEAVEEVFFEMIEEGYEVDDIIEYISESLDRSYQIIEEGYYDSAVETSKKNSKKPEVAAARRQVKIEKIKKTAKKVGSAIKSGAKVGAKAAVKAAGYAAGAAVRGAKSAKKEFTRGYERGRYGEGASDSSSSTRKPKTYRYSKASKEGVGSKLKSGLKTAVGKSARFVSRGADKLAKKLGEEVVMENNPVMDKQNQTQSIQQDQKQEKLQRQKDKQVANIQKKVLRSKMQQLSKGIPLHNSYELGEGKALGGANTKSSDTNVKGRDIRVSSGSGMTMTKAGGLGKSKSTANNPKADDIRKKYYDDQARADRRAAARERAQSGDDKLSKLIRSVQKNSFAPEGEMVDEKMNLAKADMGNVIKDFQKSDAPQFEGKTKEEIRKMAIAAKLTAERGGRKLGEDVEQIDELNRAEKETGINTKTGKPTAKGGAKDDKAFTHVKRMMRGMEGKPAGQRKKVPGKKPPTAGQWGAPRSPAQKVAMRRAAAKRSQDNMSSRFD